MNIPRVRLEWNTDDNIPPNTQFGVRLNIKSMRRCQQLYSCWLNHIPAYVLFGHEAPDAGYDYSEDGLRRFLTAYGQYCFAVTNRNEWNDWVWGRGGLPVEQVRAENEWAHRVCREFGIPFAISSTLCHDWNGGNDGITDLRRVYLNDSDIPGEYVDVHAYGGSTPSLSLLLDRWQNSGLAKPIILGEFGAAMGNEIPVREMFDAILPRSNIVAATLFAATSPDASKDYGIFGKPAEGEFYQYAREHADDKYTIGGETMPTPVTYPKVAFFFNPSGQVNTAVATVPGRPDLAKTERDMQNWFAGAKVWLYARQKHPDWYVGILGGKEEVGGDLTPLRQAFDWIVAEAKRCPDTLFVVVAGHTDSGDTPHYGYRTADVEGLALARSIRSQYQKQWPELTCLEMDGTGYIACPTGIPNLVSIIVEEAIHTSAHAVLWWVENCDRIARDIVDGSADYVAKRQNPPPAIDWKARAEAAEAKIVAAQKALA